jgi:hypothetical protein
VSPRRPSGTWRRWRHSSRTGPGGVPGARCGPGSRPRTVSWQLKPAEDEGGGQNRPADEDQPAALGTVHRGDGGARAELSQVRDVQPRPAPAPARPSPVLGRDPGRPPHPPGAAIEAAEGDETAQRRDHEYDRTPLAKGSQRAAGTPSSPAQVMTSGGWASSPAFVTSLAGMPLRLRPHWRHAHKPAARLGEHEMRAEYLRGRYATARRTTTLVRSQPG